MILAQFDITLQILRVLWHFKPIPLRKIFILKIWLRKKNLLLEGLLKVLSKGKQFKRYFVISGKCSIYPDFISLLKCSQGKL